MNSLTERTFANDKGWNRQPFPQPCPMVRRPFARSPARRILPGSLFCQPALTQRSYFRRECAMPAIETPQTNNRQADARHYRGWKHEKVFHGPPSYTHPRPPRQTAPKILCSLRRAERHLRLIEFSISKIRMGTRTHRAPGTAGEPANCHAGLEKFRTSDDM